jgi:hypothetical protein
MSENLTLWFDDIYGALRGFVSFAGGSKAIGPLVFPKKGEKAASWLDDCLNPDRSAKLDPEELLHMLKLARERGFHALIQFIGDETNYNVTPRDPKDEAEELRRNVRDLLTEVNRKLERLERAEGRSNLQVCR